MVVSDSVVGKSILRTLVCFIRRNSCQSCAGFVIYLPRGGTFLFCSLVGIILGIVPLEVVGLGVLVSTVLVLIFVVVVVCGSVIFDAVVFVVEIVIVVCDRVV